MQRPNYGQAPPNYYSYGGNNSQPVHLQPGMSAAPVNPHAWAPPQRGSN